MSLAFAKSLAPRFWNDQHGFIVSAELVLVATIGVLSMVVGLSEVALNVNNELEDVGSAFASINQSYSASGLCGHSGHTGGSKFKDAADFCDRANDIGPSGARGE
jgi:hypothetical protein